MLRTSLRHPHSLASTLLIPLLAFWSRPLTSQEKELGWSDTAELAFVSTAGNAESSTLGFSNTLKYVWRKAELRLDLGGLRAKTTTVDRRGIQLPDGTIVIDETVDSQLSAESYIVRGRYDQIIADDLFWFAGAGWEKNEFAGFERRLSAVGGAGKTWFESEAARLKTDAGFTYTDEEPVADVRVDTFFGLRLSYDYLRKLAGTTTFTSGLILDANFEHTNDYRADFTNAVAVGITNHLSLKTGLRLLYDHQPGVIAVPVVTPLGLPADGVSAFAALDELDSVLSVALVVAY